MTRDSIRAGLTWMARASAFALVAATATAQTFVMDSTPVSSCTGLFTDSGGVGGDYVNNEVLGPKTFTPGTGTSFAMGFTSWNVEGGSTCQFDALTIYDGPTTADPVIGTFCGSTGSPGTVVSSHPTGALTFEWVSDFSVTLAGWEANLICPVGTPYDDCTAAFGLPLGTTTRSLGGTPPDGSASCAGPGTDDWFTFTAPFDGFLDIDTVGSTFDTVVSVHTGCPGTAGNELDCDDDTIGFLSSLETFLTAGQNVLVRVGVDGGGVVNFAYTINAGFVPADNCASATDASAGGVFTGTLNGLSGDGGSTCDCPFVAAGNAGTDTWFSYTATASGTLRIDSGGSSFDTVLSVHASCNGTPGNELMCNDDANAGTQSEVVMPVVMGQTIVVRLAAKCDDDATNFYSVDFDFQATTSCVNAIDASAGGTFFGNLDGQSADGSTSCGCPTTMAGAPGSDQWFTYTAPGGGNLTIDTSGSAVDTVLSVHSACPGNPGNEIACNDNNVGTESRIVTPVTLGQTVLVRLAALCDATSTGAWTIDFDFLPPPPTNDACASAIPVSVGTFNGSLVGATNDFSGVCGLSGNAPDVWYRFTAPSSGDLLASTCGTHDAPGLNQGIDTVIELVDTCGGVSLTCDDDAGPPPCPNGEDQGILRDSIVELLGVNAGETILIRVSNFNGGTTGPFTLNVGFSGAPSTFPDLCNGDGGDGMGCTPCPCGNDTPMGSIGGCINSAGVGARLLPSGSKSVSAPDPGDLRMEMSGGVPSSFAVLTSGNAVAPANAANPCFGTNNGVQSTVLDGLRCAVQSTQRHGGRPVAGDGTVGSSTNGWGGASGPPSGLAAQGGFVAGQTRHYQAFYRELPGMICLTEQNTTQAVTVTFEP